MAGVSKNEIPWLRYYDRAGNYRFLLTSSRNRELYFLYEVSDGDFTKLGKDRSPKKLEEKFHVDDVLQEDL